MSSSSVAGSCLCGSIRFEVSLPLADFRYCFCSRCRKASGSAHAANGFVPETQFRWLAGEALAKRYELPTAQRFAVAFCPECGTRVPHRVKTTNRFLIPAGVLDGEPDMKPRNGIFWKSKADWVVPTDALPKF